ncbi:MAG: purine-nucleoside phosphorylase [Bacilli bacterium]
MKYHYQDYQHMLSYVREVTSFVPEIGIIIGSGLDQFISQVEIVASIPYQNIPNHPVSTNKSHKGQYIFGTYKGINVVIMEGRLHYYEGYSAEEVTAPVRLMKLMGITKLIITNACGGISYGPENMMIITDHISTNVPSPLIGENIEEFGTRFPDVSDPWDDADSEKIYQKATDSNLPVCKGVYMQFTGPQFETKAEIRMAKLLGADAVGMSTVQENIVANHMSIKTVGIATIANWACGLSPEKLSDDDVIIASRKIAERFGSLLDIALEVLHND